MAIDSALKRRAIGGIPFVPLGVNVMPDATPGVEWRQSVAWSYPGIAPDPPTPPDADAGSGSRPITRNIGRNIRRTISRLIGRGIGGRGPRDFD